MSIFHASNNTTNSNTNNINNNNNNQIKISFVKYIYVVLYKNRKCFFQEQLECPNTFHITNILLIL